MVRCGYHGDVSISLHTALCLSEMMVSIIGKVWLSHLHKSRHSPAATG